jgi:hypothetical protein
MAQATRRIRTKRTLAFGTLCVASLLTVAYIAVRPTDPGDGSSGWENDESGARRPLEIDTKIQTAFTRQNPKP